MAQTQTQQRAQARAGFARDKLALVTGATDGIGYATARALLERGTKVVVHGRNADKAREARERLARETGAEVLEPLVADFASLAAVRALAAAVRERYPALQILVNNAGVFSPRAAQTADGHALTWQVNYLAPFLLTQRLLDLLERNAPARIINVASTLHHGARLDLARVDQASAHEAYGTSKLAMVLFTAELAQRLRGSGVTVNSLHPGGVNTKLLRAGFGGGGMPVHEGARTSVHLADAVELDGVSGHYFAEGREAHADPRADDERLRRALWELSLEQTEA